MEQFKLGDEVKLKSGGPNMVIMKITEDKQFFCTWFREGEPKYATFPGEVLEHVPKLTDYGRR